MLEAVERSKKIREQLFWWSDKCDYWLQMGIQHGIEETNELEKLTSHKGKYLKNDHILIHNLVVPRWHDLQ